MAIGGCLTASLVIGAVACREKPLDAVRIVPQIDPAQPRRVAFAPQVESELLVVEASGLVGVWEIGDPAHPVRKAWIPAGAIDAAFTLDGREIVTAGWDGRIRWWSSNGELLRVSTSGHAGPARALGIGDGVVLSGGEDGALFLWGADGAPRHGPLAAHEGFVVSVAVAPNGDMASAGTDQNLLLWQADESAPSGYRSRVLHREVERRPTLAHLLKMDVHMGWDRTVGFSPGVLAAAGFDRAIRRWNPSDWDAPPSVHGSDRMVRALAWWPRDDRLAAGGFDGTLRLWRSRDAQPVIIARNPAPILSVAFSSSGELLATASIDERVRLWKADGKPFGELPVGAKPRSTTVALTESGPLFASVNPAGELELLRPDGSPESSLGTAPPGSLPTLALLPDGTLFAGGTRDDARLYTPGGIVKIEPTVDMHISTAEFSPGGDILAIAGTAGMVELLNGDGSPRTKRFDACREVIYGFAFVKGELVILCDDGVASKWTLDGRPAGPLLEAEAGAARGIAISPDAERLASGRVDGTVAFWSMPPGRPTTDVSIGLNIDSVGLHGGGTWVVANRDAVFFFDHAQRLVATALVTPAGVVAYTPDGIVAGSKGAERFVRAFRPDGTMLSDAEMGERLRPATIASALRMP